MSAQKREDGLNLQQRLTAAENSTVFDAMRGVHDVLAVDHAPAEERTETVYAAGWRHELERHDVDGILTGEFDSEILKALSHPHFGVSETAFTIIRDTDRLLAKALTEHPHTPERVDGICVDARSTLLSQVVQLRKQKRPLKISASA